MDESTGLLSGVPRQSLTPWRRQTAFALCILCCLCEGSITLFSLYTPTLLSLGYTATQINTVAIAAEIGMYLPAPILGYIGDKHGHSKLAALAGTLLCSSYCIAAYCVHSQLSYKLLAFCFAFVGVGTTAFYIFAFVTCAHLYPTRSSLAISAPVASFGLSSLWQSQLIPKLFGIKALSSKSPTVFIDCTNAFAFFAAFYVVFATVGYMAVQLAGGDDDAHGDSTKTNTQSKTSLRQLVQFMLKTETWILMVTFILVSGPLETYLNNVGSIISTTTTMQTPSRHVAVFSAFSTLARLTVGAFSDYLRPKVSTATIVAVILGATGVVHGMLASGRFDFPNFYYSVSAINGFSYGALFTLYPTMVALIWGVEGFGSHWGLFILGPAIGSVFYGILFGNVYQSHSTPLGICLGNKCYELTFYLSGSGICLAALLELGLWKYSWIKEGIAL